MKSIRTRLELLFILFFLLITISVAATFWGLQAQAEDALMINLAGRQRMLVQQMTRLTMETQSSPAANAALTETAQAFENTLLAFQSGGQVQYPADNWVDVPQIDQPQVQEQLGRVERLWQDYRSEIDDLFSAPVGIPPDEQRLSDFRQLSTQLAAETDWTVRALQEDSRARIQRLRNVQVGFFTAALILLGIGAWLVRGEILRPLKRLGASADRIRSGDLRSPINGGGPTEIVSLSRTFERMRAELELSHRQLAAWNQTLEEKVQGRTKELDALYSVSREISARLDRREVLNSITDKASELLKAEVAFLCLIDPEMGTLDLQALTGPENTVRQFSSPLDNPFVQAVVQQPHGHFCKANGCHGTCGILDLRYRTSHMAAPLEIENRVIGALCVGDRRADAFSEEAPALLTRLASAAAVAIENARLYEQAERLATLEERQRIAAAMHDGLAQRLYALGLLLEQVDDTLETGSSQQAGELLYRARANLTEASTEVRRAIANLQEEPPGQKSIQEQLREVIRQQALEAGRKIEWQEELDGCLLLSVEDTQQVLGIAQEALTNARRHSNASHIRVQLQPSDGEATLNILDNGRGFDPAEPNQDGRQHFGLKILAARAAQLGGQLSVDSAPGRGACISLRWPIKQPFAPRSSGRNEII